MRFRSSGSILEPLKSQETLFGRGCQRRRQQALTLKQLRHGVLERLFVYFPLFVEVLQQAVVMVHRDLDQVDLVVLRSCEIAAPNKSVDALNTVGLCGVGAVYPHPIREILTLQVVAGWVLQPSGV